MAHCFRTFHNANFFSRAPASASVRPNLACCRMLPPELLRLSFLAGCFLLSQVFQFALRFLRSNQVRRDRLHIRVIGAAGVSSPSGECVAHQIDRLMRGAASTRRFEAHLCSHFSVQDNCAVIEPQYLPPHGSDPSALPTNVISGSYTVCCSIKGRYRSHLA